MTAFRGRLTFPIRDRRGRVIAFSARILGAGEPKYLNSPETPLFDKGRTLFNIDRAAEASRQAARVIVVEGQMDVIALDQAGIAEAVAPLGTAMTEHQLELLWRLSPTPILCFDGDAAGQKAAIRGALRALPHVGPGRSLNFATLPAGQDPDDLVRSGGREAVEDLLRAPESLIERLWKTELGAEPIDTPEQKAGLRRRLLDHAATIGDRDVQEGYRRELLARLAELTRPAQREWRPSFARGGRFAPSTVRPQRKPRRSVLPAWRRRPPARSCRVCFVIPRFWRTMPRPSPRCRWRRARPPGCGTRWWKPPSSTARLIQMGLPPYCGPMARPARSKDCAGKQD
jgi:DNA primase